MWATIKRHLALGLVRVVQAPPRVRRALRPAGRRVLPVLLAAERGQVEEGPDAAERLDAATPGRVGEEDAIAIAEEHVKGKILRRPQLALEVLAADRVPGDLPAHPAGERLDLALRRARDERERGVARVQVRERADLVGEHRAAPARLAVLCQTRSCRRAAAGVPRRGPAARPRPRAPRTSSRSRTPSSAAAGGRPRARRAGASPPSPSPAAQPGRASTRVPSTISGSDISFLLLLGSFGERTLATCVPSGN